MYVDVVCVGMKAGACTFNDAAESASLVGKDGTNTGASARNCRAGAGTVLAVLAVLAVALLVSIR